MLIRASGWEGGREGRGDRRWEMGEGRGGREEVERGGEG